MDYETLQGMLDHTEEVMNVLRLVVTKHSMDFGRVAKKVEVGFDNLVATTTLMEGMNEMLLKTLTEEGDELEYLHTANIADFLVELANYLNGTTELMREVNNAFEKLKAMKQPEKLAMLLADIQRYEAAQEEQGED